jgi:hypothetical protein
MFFIPEDRDQRGEFFVAIVVLIRLGGLLVA